MKWRSLHLKGKGGAGVPPAAADVQASSFTGSARSQAPAWEPEKKTRSRSARLLRSFAFPGLLLAGAWLAMSLLPILPALLSPVKPGVEWTDRHGRPLREELVDGRQFNRPASLPEIPQNLIDATLAAEDQRFFRHPGVDVLAIARALADGIRHRRVVSGASTITQQLIKLAEPRPRTLRSKFVEAALSLRLERAWSKRQILEAYMNRLDYGNLRIGCASAAHYYLGKPLSQLSVAESAFLAGLPQSPVRLNPHLHPDRARERQHRVLERMLRAGRIDEPTYKRALVEKIQLRPAQRIFRAPHFVDLLLKSGERPDTGRVVTTLDLDLQAAVERIIRERLTALTGKNVKNAAAVVIDNASGDVLALVGSEDYFEPGSGQVNGAWARRSPGSALKPFTYLLAFERGATPASIVADIPTDFPTATGTYSPTNYNGRCYGPVRYRVALANSLNIAAVKVLAASGGPAALRLRLQELGLETVEASAEHYGLGLTLGNAEVRLLELTNAYAALARLGEYLPYRLRTDAPATPPLRFTRPERAWLIADILSDNHARSLAFGLHSPLRFDFPVACKTGTSTDFRDNWAMGYTPEFTVGVWAGNFDGSAMHDLSGVTGAAPILHDIFERLHVERGTRWYDPPAGIVSHNIDPVSGKLVDSGGVREHFAPGSIPDPQGSSDTDAEGRYLLPPIYASWLAGPDNWLGSRAVIAPDSEENLHILSPAPGITYVLDPDLPQSSRYLPLRAAGNDVTWSSDSLEIRREGSEVFAVLTEGRHRVIAKGPSRQITAWINVRSL